MKTLVQQGQEVLVEDLPLALGELQEGLVDASQLFVLEFVAQLLEAARESVPPGVPAKDKERLLP